ncbi:VOC family protein [Pollutimonas sp. H1-120]|uniref:VOC family protein n=1 Tax=Pollutimonas sp. H1-120 TaxID=3148824 RepID=UPI003B51BAE2
MKILINIDVPELGPAIDFYSAALSLSLGRVIDDDVAELTGASSTIYLLRKAAGSPPAESIVYGRRYTRHWTPVHVDFVVDDIEEAAKRALCAGALQEGGCVQWMGSKCISFSDPFGHGFCLIEFAGETYSGDAD